MSESVDYWNKKVAGYATEEWAQKPSLFAQEAIRYFPSQGKLLELGAGLGKDSEWFALRGYEVTAADQIEVPSIKGVKIKLVDMSKALPFDKASFDIVYAHLSLHYFSYERTKDLFVEIYEILKPGGVLAFLVNSTSDPELNEGEEIETHFRRVDGIDKRYFDTHTVAALTSSYKVMLLDDKGTSYKDRAKGMTHLVRFVGMKQ